MLVKGHAGLLADQGGEIVGADAQLIRHVVELNALDGVQIDILQSIAGQKGLFGHIHPPEESLVQLL